MLNIFRQKENFPNYRLVQPKSGKRESITVHSETSSIRPYVSAAILRNVTLTQEAYDSFISLQDKLHQNLARGRTLVAIGTHDLDTVEGPFSYEALPPKDISFKSLNQTKERNAEEMMEFYKTDRQLNRYLHIIRDSPVYPVIYDSKRTVCSMPPIINSDHSKITLKTKNILIEMTGTDRTKLEVVNNIMVAMFSQYCGDKYTIEPVDIISPHNKESRTTPDIRPRIATAEVDYINSSTGLSESPESMCKLLAKMGLSATPSKSDTNIIDVSVPPTRADVFHQCDIMEDVAIAYSFNKLPRSTPSKSATIGKPLLINNLTDHMRNEAARCGWTEVMPLILCSHDENFTWLNRKDTGFAIKLANPKTAEYQIVRTSLLPGLLKTLRENKSHSIPIKIFEASEVAFKDESLERKARNERHFAAVFYSQKAGFEKVHGLLDRLMLMLKIPHVGLPEDEGKNLDGYYLKGIEEDTTFFPKRAAAIHLRQNGKDARIGELGILHPDVLENFELP